MLGLACLPATGNDSLALLDNEPPYLLHERGVSMAMKPGHTALNTYPASGGNRIRNQLRFWAGLMPDVSPRRLRKPQQAATTYSLAWPIVFCRLIRNIECQRGRLSWHRLERWLQSNCFDRTQDDVEAVLADVSRRAGESIHNLHAHAPGHLLAGIVDRGCVSEAPRVLRSPAADPGIYTAVNGAWLRSRAHQSRRLERSQIVPKTALASQPESLHSWSGPYATEVATAPYQPSAKTEPHCGRHMVATGGSTTVSSDLWGGYVHPGGVKALRSVAAERMRQYAVTSCPRVNPERSSQDLLCHVYGHDRWDVKRSRSRNSRQPAAPIVEAIPLR